MTTLFRRVSVRASVLSWDTPVRFFSSSGRLCPSPYHRWQSAHPMTGQIHVSIPFSDRRPVAQHSSSLPLSHIFDLAMGIGYLDSATFRWFLTDCSEVRSSHRYTLALSPFNCMPCRPYSEYRRTFWRWRLSSLVSLRYKVSAAQRRGL